MRGQTYFNIMANNVLATTPDKNLKKYQNKKPKMCWICQKEKSTYQGSLILKPGLHKFVCKDCLDEKAAKKI